MNEQTVTQSAEELNKPITSNDLELDANRAKLADLKQQVVVKLALLKMADIATMLMLFIFMVGFYVADPFHLVTFMTDGFNKNPAEMFTYFVLLAFAGIMAYTIAHLKREHYHHTARHNKNVWKVGIVLVIFSMTGEIYNSLGSQQHSQFSKAESSAMFKSIAGTEISVNTGNGLELAQASGKLAACKTRLAEGKEKTCSTSQARVDSLKESATIAANAGASAATAASAQKTKDMLAIVDLNVHPFYKALAEMGIPQKIAALLLAAFVAYAFERMHLTLPEDLKDLYQQIAALESDGLAIAKAGLNAGSFSHVPENHLGITTRGRGFEVPPEKQPVGFGYPKKAAAFKYESSAASADTLPRIEKPFGFLPRDSKPVNTDLLDTDLLNAENRRKYPQTNATGKSPDDYSVIPRKDANLGTQKPLGQTLERLGIPSHPSHTEAAKTADESSLDDRLKRVADELYPSWIKAIKAGEITHAKDPCQKFIWKHDIKGDGVTVLSANETQRIWASWQYRAGNDGVLTANAKYQAGNRQPKYLKA
jgi:hypothetical protein